MAEIVKTVISPNALVNAFMAGTPNAAFSSVVFTAVATGGYIVDDNADQRLTILAQNAGTSTATITLKAGNGICAAAGDVTINIPANATVAIPMACIDSARVKITNGANKGQIAVVVSAALSVAVISLL